MKKLIICLITVMLLILVFITPFEARLLNQDLTYMYWLNIVETFIFAVGIATGVFFTLTWKRNN